MFFIQTKRPLLMFAGFLGQKILTGISKPNIKKKKKLKLEKFKKLTDEKKRTEKIAKDCY